MILNAEQIEVAIRRVCRRKDGIQISSGRGEGDPEFEVSSIVGCHCEAQAIAPAIPQ